MPEYMVVLRSDFLDQIIPAAHFFYDRETKDQFLLDCKEFYDDLTDLQVYILGDAGLYRLLAREVRSHA